MKRYETDDPLQKMSERMHELQDNIALLHRKTEKIEVQYTELEFLQQQDRKLFAELNTTFRQGDMHDTIEETQPVLRANERKLYMQMEEELKQGKRQMRSYEDQEMELYLQCKQYSTGAEKE